MSKGQPNNRQKDIAKLLRDRSAQKGFGAKAQAFRPTKMMRPGSNGR